MEVFLVALHYPKRGTLKKSHATNRQKSYVRGHKFPFRPVFFYLEVGLLPLQAESNGSSNCQVGYNKSCKSTTPSHLYPWLQPKWFPLFHLQVSTSPWPISNEFPFQL